MLPLVKGIEETGRTSCDTARRGGAPGGMVHPEEPRANWSDPPVARTADRATIPHHVVPSLTETSKAEIREWVQRMFQWEHVQLLTLPGS